MAKVPRKLPYENRLIASLPSTERVVLLRHCETIELAFGEELCTQHQSYTHAYFPVTALISLMTAVDDHPPMEMGMVGYDGVLGATLILAMDLVPQLAVVQGPGTALRIPAPILLNLLPDSPVLLYNMQRYLFRLLMQVSRSTACTRFHQVEQRLARWLLMTHDRVHADHFHLTHQFLADMLGVQRSGVTIASGGLKHNGLIGYSRGEISIYDRAGLEAAACECYAAEQLPVAS